MNWVAGGSLDDPRRAGSRIRAEEQVLEGLRPREGPERVHARAGPGAPGLCTRQRSIEVPRGQKLRAEIDRKFLILTMP